MMRLFLDNVLEVSKYLIVFSVFMKGNIYKGKRKYVGLCILVGGVCAYSFLLKTDSTIGSVIYTSAVVFTLYQGNVKNKFIYYLVSLLSVNYIDVIIIALMGYVLKGKIWWYYIYETGWEGTKERAITVGIIMGISLIAGKKRNHTALFNSVDILQYILLLVAMTGLYVIFIITMMLMAYGNPTYRNRLIILITISAVLTIACILAFFIYSNKLKNENEIHEQNLRLYADNTERTRDYLDEMKSLNDDIRKYRHDFRHHVAAMEGLVEEGEYAELKGYLDQLAEINEDLNQSRVIFTGNYVVDAIFCGIKAREEFRDVEVQCDGVLPEEICILDTDLCTVLANSLENALEAGAACPYAHIVQLRVGCYENMIKFQIKNTYDDKNYEALAANDFHSTKRNSKRHGLGIKSMRDVVEKYHGKLEYHVEREWVTTEIYMQQEFPRQKRQTD